MLARLEPTGLPILKLAWTSSAPVAEPAYLPGTDGNKGATGVNFLTRVVGRNSLTTALPALLEAWRLSGVGERGCRLTILTKTGLYPEQLSLYQGADGLANIEWCASVNSGTWRHLCRTSQVYFHLAQEEMYLESLLDSLHAGMMCIAPDGPMTREILVQNGERLPSAPYAVDGIVVPVATKTGVSGPCSAFPDPSALCRVLMQLADPLVLGHRLANSEPGLLKARQHAFRLTARASLLNEPRPRIGVVLDPPADVSPGMAWPENAWYECLLLHGYEVDCVAPHTKGFPGNLSTTHFDAIWMGDGQIQDANRIEEAGQAPILVWAGQRWPDCVQRLKDCDVSRVAIHAVVAPCPDDIMPLRGKVPTLYVPPGTSHTGGAQPPGMGSPGDSAHPVAAIAVFGGEPTSRELLYHTFEAAGHCVSRRSPGEGCQEARSRPGHHFAIGLTGDQADGVAAVTALLDGASRGVVTLIEQDGTLARMLPGLPVFRTSAEALRLVTSLCDNAEDYVRLQSACKAQVLRHHTWNDRVRLVLGWTHLLFGRGLVSASPPRKAALFQATVEREGRKLQAYWEDRAVRRGVAGASHISWDEARLRCETTTLWRRLRPYLERHLPKGARTALDFGCGPGRLSRLLASDFDLAVTGVDISQSYLEMARRACRLLTFEPILLDLASLQLLVADAQFDLILSVNSLQCVPDTVFDRVTWELNRALKPGGVIILVENTESRIGRISEAGHVTFRRPQEYQRAFRGLQIVQEFLCEGERQSLMIYSGDGGNSIENSIVWKNRADA